MRRHKFLLLIFILVVLLFICSGYVLYASLTSESGELVFPFFDADTPKTTELPDDTTTKPPVVTTSPEDRVCYISFYSGTEWLYTDAVKYGEMPKYVGKTPEKKPDEQYIYSFQGWSEELSPATESKSYTAVFSKLERLVSVTFLDSAGNLLESKTVPYNSSVTCDKLPDGYKDERFEYTPIGWTQTNGLSDCVDLSAVKTDMVLYPAFSVTRHSSLVTFANADGTILQQSFVKIGQVPKYSQKTPTMPSDGVYNYKFETWDRGITAVGDEDITYTALYSNEYCIYTVTFSDSKTGNKVQIKVPYGSEAIYPNKIPDIKYGAYVYEFAFWAVSDTLAEPADLTNITQDITVFAYYTQKMAG